MVRSKPRTANPWTVEEHANFVRGVQKVGRGRWALISKLFVPSRTPTQVASHAQKYFIRLEKKENKQRTRKSIFDADARVGDDDELSSTSGDKENQVKRVPSPKIVKVREVTPDTRRAIPPFQAVILPPEMNFNIFYFQVMYSHWCRSMRMMRV